MLRDLDFPIRATSKSTELLLSCCEIQREILKKIEKSVSGLGRLDEIASLLKQLLLTIQEPPSQPQEAQAISNPVATTDKYAASVDVLEFSPRIRNCLRAEEIQTVRDLKCTSEVELLKIPNMGWKSVLEIYRAQSEFGDDPIRREWLLRKVKLGLDPLAL